VLPAGKQGRKGRTGAGEGLVASQGRTDGTGRTRTGGGHRKEIRWGKEDTCGPSLSLSHCGIWKK
jgi:hypothetical protein